jgi:hypothetical protein
MGKTLKENAPKMTESFIAHCTATQLMAENLRSVERELPVDDGRRVAAEVEAAKRALLWCDGHAALYVDVRAVSIGDFMEGTEMLDRMRIAPRPEYLRGVAALVNVRLTRDGFHTTVIQRGPGAWILRASAVHIADAPPMPRFPALPTSSWQ